MADQQDDSVKVVDRRWWARGDDAGESQAGQKPTFVEELERRGYRMSVLAVRRYINERVTILEVCRPQAEQNS